VVSVPPPVHVNDDVPHADDLLPRDGRILPGQTHRELGPSLSDTRDLANNVVLKHELREEFNLSRHPVLLNRLDVRRKKLVDEVFGEPLYGCSYAGAAAGDAGAPRRRYDVETVTPLHRR
jgi:hypothetical protein